MQLHNALCSHIRLSGANYACVELVLHEVGLSDLYHLHTALLCSRAQIVRLWKPPVNTPERVIDDARSLFEIALAEAALELYRAPDMDQDYLQMVSCFRGRHAQHAFTTLLEVQLYHFSFF